MTVSCGNVSTIKDSGTQQIRCSMILQRLEHSQHKNDPEHNPWEVRDLIFDARVNLIVGRNATGKTRVMNVLRNCAAQISGKIPRLMTGSWTLTFETFEKATFAVYCDIVDGEVREERITRDGEILLSRRGESGEIKNDHNHETMSYEPPRNKLTLHVRRDKKEYPYLEDLFDWGDNYYGYMFASRRPSELLAGPGVEGAPLESLDSVPHLLKEALGKGVAAEAIVSDMRSVGYPIEKIAVKKLDPLNALIITVQEQDIPCEIVQTEISAGMYRALSAVVILNYLLLQETPCTLAVDDIGEGLDFERSVNLIKLLLQKTKKSDIQLMLTSNDRHLLNAVDVQSWNILERKGGKVRAFNYANSKQAFDDFAMTGLSNFDFLSGRMYKETKAGP